MSKHVCALAFWRRILILVCLLVRCRTVIGFTFYRSTPLYTTSCGQNTFHQPRLGLATKASILHPLHHRQLAPLQLAPLSWLTDKVKKLVQYPRLTRQVQRYVAPKKHVSSKPVKRQSLMQPDAEGQQTLPTATLSRKSLSESVAGVDLTKIAFPPAA